MENVLMNQNGAITSLPYFGVKLRKKLTIVTLSWPNVTLIYCEL